MRRILQHSLFLLAFLCPAAGVFAADNPAAKTPQPGAPTDAKALKTWDEAIAWEHRHVYDAAISSYRKANRQDGGHCAECLQRAYRLALQSGADKDAEAVAREIIAGAESAEAKASGHYLLGLALQRQGIADKKEKCFTESCDEFHAAVDANPKMTVARFGLGLSLANLHKDEDARKEFAAYLDQDKSDSVMRARAERYAGNVELARAKMAPPFAITTLDGQHISLDKLAGKVVLIDFWATWCGPCREALPHMRKIAQKFSEQPLVIISISLDKDDAKWKEFVARNGMTWLQYRDGNFDGAIAKLFAVHAIPATFTIDADGVLEDQHVGDADIEGKLKKLVARAAEVEKRKAVQVAAEPGNGGS